MQPIHHHDSDEAQAKLTVERLQHGFVCCIFRHPFASPIRSVRLVVELSSPILPSPICFFKGFETPPGRA